VDRVCGRHDGERLFHIVDVEGGNPVVVLSGMVEQLAEGNSGHPDLLSASGTSHSRRCRGRFARCSDRPSAPPSFIPTLAAGYGSAAACLARLEPCENRSTAENAYAGIVWQTK